MRGRSGDRRTGTEGRAWRRTQETQAPLGLAGAAGLRLTLTPGSSPGLSIPWRQRCPLRCRGVGGLGLASYDRSGLAWPFRRGAPWPFSNHLSLARADPDPSAHSTPDPQPGLCSASPDTMAPSPSWMKHPRRCRPRPWPCPCTGGEAGGWLTGRPGQATGHFITTRPMSRDVQCCV